MSDQDLSVKGMYWGQNHSYLSNTLDKRNKFEIVAKVTIGVKWKFQAVAKIGQQITSY